jgi:SAM-dependent methyltransferase
MAETATAALDLLRPADRERARVREAGYVDLLDEEPESTGRGQDLMLSRTVPVVYERWWRPSLGRIVKGVTGPGMDEEVRIARLLLGLSSGHRVLDVACGPANFTRAFAATVGPEGIAVGVDVSPTMLAKGAQESVGLDNLALLRADATDLPFEDGSFDGVCCFAALHLFAEPFEAIGEMARVLAPGGRIALLTSIRRRLAVPPLKPVVERVSGLRVFERDEVVSALRQRGFVDVHQRISGLVQFVGGRLPR